MNGRKMKWILLLVATALLLSGCGHWWHGGHGSGHGHHRDCPCHSG